MPRKPKKAGRPPLAKGEAKAGTLRVRVTPDELKSIESAAKRTNQTVSEWIRSMLNAVLCHEKVKLRHYPLFGAGTDRLRSKRP
jgi:predicted HicB family RNase H-like nuclease